MGCESFVNKKLKGNVWRFHVFCAAILSSQTKDQITYAAVHRLIKHNGCTITAINDMKEKDLAQILHPVGF